MPEETFDLVIRGQRVLTTAGTAPREVGVRGGKVAAVEPFGVGLSGTEVIELAADETLIPGLVDTHVHVNEPGRTEWEGFASATRAAAAGGVTTIIDMPLNSIPPTTTVDGLNRKREVAGGQAFVDVGFWGGAVPGNKAELRALHEEGVFGFKCFLLPSGVDEFPHLDAEELEEDLAELQSFDSLMIVHAEDSRAIDRAPHAGGVQYAAFLASRPRGAENKAIAEVIERARWTGARAHIVHLSSSDALPMIASAKRDGVRLTVETCPHYLTLTAEEIPDGATAYKCCPPIREAANRELLWKGLEDGTIDCIVSDHSPSTLDLKDLENGDFAVAWGGVSSLQLGLPLIWTEARQRGIPLEQVVSWMAGKPAALARLSGKGQLALGYDADFSI
ncbi:MAG TPA: allantoinase AllB, partial [Arthrobacter sp.]|nr:allantoinase AllB [Arthrobacter sp.]